MAPALHEMHDLAERDSQWRERVLHAGWHFRVHLAMDESVTFQLSKLASEHAWSDARQSAMQFVESVSAFKKDLHCCELPLTAYDRDGDLNRTNLGRRAHTGTIHKASMCPG